MPTTEDLVRDLRVREELRFLGDYLLENLENDYRSSCSVNRYHGPDGPRDVLDCGLPTARLLGPGGEPAGTAHIGMMVQALRFSESDLPGRMNIDQARVELTAESEDERIFATEEFDASRAQTLALENRLREFVCRVQAEHNVELEFPPGWSYSC